MTGGGNGDVPGGADWTEQARRLLETLSGTVAGMAEAVAATGTAGPGEGAGERAGEGTAESHPPGCRWCLHCQVTALLRGDRPELSAALADVLATTAAALRSFSAGTDAPPSPPGGADGRDGTDDPPDVQRIEIA